MPKSAAARKMAFSEEPLNSLDEILAATNPQSATPDPTPPIPPGTNPPPGHPDHHKPRNPPPDIENPRPRPDDPNPYDPAPVQLPNGDENVAPGADEVANPDVPGSEPDPNQNPGLKDDDIPNRAASASAVLDGSPVILSGEIMPRNSRYEARITILDAFHYPGSFREAPEWVDRNWLGYGDDDPLRNIPAGPCLRVPTHNRMGDVVLARVGDYVTRQEVRLAPGIPGDIRVEVWAKEQFEKMFLPVVS